MTKEKLCASDNIILRTIGSVFSIEQLSGNAMPISNFINLPDHGHPSPYGEGKGVRTFDSRMADVGWIRSQAWSSYFVELVYKHAMHPYPKYFKALNEIFSGSCLDVYRKMDISFTYHKTQLCQPGAIAFWQYGNSWMGHAGIVLQNIGNNQFTCMEAHNVTGKEDGFFLKVKTRSITTRHKPSGLNLMGFIIPTITAKSVDLLTTKSSTDALSASPNQNNSKSINPCPRGSLLRMEKGRG